MEVTSSDLQRTYSIKSDEELLLLHGSGTLTKMAYEALEAELARRMLPAPPRPRETAEVDAAKESYQRMTLSAHWRGHAPLASAYWLLGTLTLWVLYAASVVVQRVVPVLLPAAVAILSVFIVFTWISIWRCWKNCHWRVWGYLARAQVLIFVFIIAAVIVRLLLDAGGFTGPQQRSIFE